MNRRLAELYYIAVQTSSMFSPPSISLNVHLFSSRYPRYLCSGYILYFLDGASIRSLRTITSHRFFLFASHQSCVRKRGLRSYSRGLFQQPTERDTVVAATPVLQFHLYEPATFDGGKRNAALFLADHQLFFLASTLAFNDLFIICYHSFLILCCYHMPLQRRRKYILS